MLFQTQSGQPQAQKGQGRIDQQEFEAELIFPTQLCRQARNKVGQNGSHNHNQGYPHFAHRPAGKQAITEQTQQRPVGVAGKGKNGIDDATVGDHLTVKNKDADKHQRHTDMHGLADIFTALGRVAFVQIQNIDAERGGDGRHGRVGRGIGRTDESQHKQQCRPKAQIGLHGNVGENLIPLDAHGIQIPSAMGRIGHQNHAQRKEQHIDQKQCNGKPPHIFLRILQGAHCQVFLHHALVEAGHGNGNENPGQELLPKIPRIVVVVEKEGFAIRTVVHQFGQIADTHVHVASYQDNGQHQGGQHKGGLQGVGYNDGFDAALGRIEPNEHNGKRAGYPKRNAQAVEQNQLQHARHQKKPERSTRHPGNQEKDGAGFVGSIAESFAQVGINRGEVHPVIHRQQHVGNHKIAHHKAQHHLQVGKLLAFDPSWHRNKGYARQRCADHPEGHQIPGRLAFGPEKHFVGILTAGDA